MSLSALFIDAGYLNRLLRYPLGGARVEFGKVLSVLSEGTDLLRAFYYDGYPWCAPSPSADELLRRARKQRFLAHLRAVPRLEARIGRLERLGTPPQVTYRPRRLEGMMAVDMLTLVATKPLGQVILVAGNADYAPILQAVKDWGVSVRLWHGPRGEGTSTTVHEERWHAADDRRELTALVVARCAPCSPAPGA